MIKQNIIIATLSLLTAINILGICYSYLIIKTNFFKQFKIQKRPHKLKNFYTRLPLICLNVIILLVITGTGLYFFSDIIIGDFKGVWVMLFEIAVILLIDDIYFYLWHRTMHENKFLYRSIHKTHHCASTPFPSEYLYAHPVEWIIGMVGPFLGIFLLQGVSIYSFWMVLIIRNLHELDIHSGIKSSFLTKYFPFSGTNEHHDLHHATLNGNYASTFSVWDKIFKTTIKTKPKFYN
ncbi:MAG: hypothetical protein CMG00_05795 [Candidatus Marinimicrobia bacterium]|nr:hypothetical protein [Candidatus Neomarinimicrobiota bacterium]|tara:strand:+ start:126 stop:833 length:708 start_codon:yes stop_codon:yes gene_type:complete